MIFLGLSLCFCSFTDSFNDYISQIWQHRWKHRLRLITIITGFSCTRDDVKSDGCQLDLFIWSLQCQCCKNWCVNTCYTCNVAAIKYMNMSYFWLVARVLIYQIMRLHHINTLLDLIHRISMVSNKSTTSTIPIIPRQIIKYYLPDKQAN